MLVLGLAGFWCLGCAKEQAPPPVAEAKNAPVASAPELSFIGCEGLDERPTCLRPRNWKRPLVVHLPGEPGAEASLRVRLDGEALAPTAYATRRTGEGLWVQFDEPKPGEFEFELEGHEPAELHVEMLSEAYTKLRKTGRDDPELDERERALLACNGARLEAFRGSVLSTDALRALGAKADAVGERACVPLAAASFVAMAINDSDLATAEAMLELLAEHASYDLEAQIHLLHYRALFDAKRGLAGRALRGFEASERLALGANFGKLLGTSRSERAQMLANLGRFDEALEVAAAAEATAATSQHAILRDSILRQARWIEVMHRQRDPNAPDPSPGLRELRESIAARIEDPDPNALAATTLDLAVARLELGDVEEAEALLDAVDREALRHDRQQLYWELTRARLALARREFEPARERIERAQLLARTVDLGEFGLELALTLASLERAAGLERAALDAYAAADELAETLARRVPASHGRSHYWTTQTRGRAEHISLALELGEDELALCTALGARARHLGALSRDFGELELGERSSAYTRLLVAYQEAREQAREQRDQSWQLSKPELAELELSLAARQRELDALLEQALAELEGDARSWVCAQARPTRPGDALLVVYPKRGLGEGWWFILDRPGRAIEHVDVREVGPGNAAQVGLAKLGAAGAFDELDVLELVPLGAMLSVDFHALASLGGPEGPAIRYGLGLGVRDRPEPGATKLRAAVVGSGKNLSAVEDEVAEVRELAGARGWSVEPRWEPGAGEQPQIVHYAGHGKHEGLDGWHTHITLSSGERVDAETLLLGNRAPSVVVLSACETGTIDPEMLDGGMNLAVALLLSGSELVIAADRKVADVDARAFARALYTALPTEGPVDSHAFVEALARVQRDDAQARFDAWRAWVP